MARKSSNEKLRNSGDMPKIVAVTDPREIARNGGTKLLIAPPLAYDEIMRRIPFGKVITSDAIRAYLARQNGADSTCPLTAGIFINIAALASSERMEDETPYWRTLKREGELNEKYPGGIEAQRARLEQEGHTILQKGKRCFVQNYQASVFALEEGREENA